MSTYDVVLALHIMCVLGAFFLSGALHVSEYLMKGAGTVAEVRRLTVTGKFAPLFAPLVIGIFGFGLWLLHLDEGAAYHAKDAWIATAMVVLLILFLDGPLVMARYGKKLQTLVAATPDGPVTDEIQHEVRATVPWVVGHANSFAALSVILLMTSKPSAATSIVTVLVGTVVGAAIGFVLSRR